MKLLDASSGRWEEERLLLWSEIERLQGAQTEEKAKAKHQIDAAHAKIRDLETLKWKMWAALIPAAAVVVVELLKLYVRH
jgi:hypothetical protein